MQFQWDENKNRLNKKKHGISFEAAALIFHDPCLLSIPDSRHFYEGRWQSLGLISTIVIYVAHTGSVYNSFAAIYKAVELVKMIENSR